MRRFGLCTLVATLAAISGADVYGQVFSEAVLPSQAATTEIATTEPSTRVEALQAAPQTYHNGWASIVDGKLKGRATSITDAGDIAGIANAQVALLMNAQVIGRTSADSGGNFVIEGVTPGIYGITVESENGFAAHSFNAVNATQQNSGMNVYVSKLPRRVVDELLQSLWTPDSGSASAPPFIDLAPRGNSLIQSHQVRMVNGVVYGEVIFENPLAAPANHFVKVFSSAGGLVSTQRVDSFGKFSFMPPAPGLYNIVVGGGAYACVAVQVLANNEAAALSKTGVRFVSAPMQNVPSTLVICAIGPPPAPLGSQDDFAGGFVGPGGAPAFAGGGGGFGGGGGGFGGGGGLGGLGGLLGIAGLAVGIVALADDDDGFSPPPGTPVVP